MLSHDFSFSKNPIKSAVQGIRKSQIPGFKRHMVLSSLCTPSLDSKPQVLEPPDTQRILAKKSVAPGKKYSMLQVSELFFALTQSQVFPLKDQSFLWDGNCWFLPALKIGIGIKPKLLSYKLLLQKTLFLCRHSPSCACFNSC